MRVQIVHHDADGKKTDLGVRELSHMPPIDEPFPINDEICYTAKAYFGPDHDENYLLVLQGEPQPIV